MKFLYGLIVAILHGFIIQCEAASGGKVPRLPDHLIEAIIFGAGLQTTKNAGQEIKLAGNVMKRIFAHHIIVINPRERFNGSQEDFVDGDFVLRVGGYDRFMSLFKRFGENVRRISINYNRLRTHERKEVNERIIKKYAHQLTELRIISENDDGLWEEFSNDNGELRFEEVKKFHFIGSIKQKSINLKLIFPKLDSIRLLRFDVPDTNLLENVTKLKELELCRFSLEENLLDRIFGNNKQISNLNIEITNKNEIFRLIEKHLKKLKSLGASTIDREFLTRVQTSGHVYNFTSITSFSLTIIRTPEFNESSNLMGDLSFDMPELKMLSLRTARLDKLITTFINQFKKLETLKMTSIYSFTEDTIENLRHVKKLELIESNFEETRPSTLEKIFEKLDVTASNLNTIKLLYFRENEYSIYERKIKRINDHLERLRKPTWTLSRGCQEHTGKQYLIFERD